MLPDIKQDWFSNVRGDVLAGVEVIGLDEASATLVGKYAVHGARVPI